LIVIPTVFRLTEIVTQIINSTMSNKTKAICSQGNDANLDGIILEKHRNISIVMDVYYAITNL